MMRPMAGHTLDLNGAVSHASAAVFAVDGDGRIAIWNRATEKLLGYPAREVIGRPSCEVFRPERAGDETLCYRGCHARLISLDTPMGRVDLRTRTDAGHPIRLSVSALVIAGPTARGPTVMHLLRELTAPKPPLASAGASDEADAPRGDRRPLTRREIDVLRLMDAGLDTRMIAGTLCVSHATVRNHVQSILGKLVVHSRLAAVAAAHRGGLL